MQSISEKPSSGLGTYLKYQSFHPGFLSIFLNPMYIIRKQLRKSIADAAPSLNGRLIDFGCGRKPYRNLFSVSEYVGVDIETTGHDHSNSMVDIYYDGKTIPLPDESFDSLFCSEVIEHLFNPDLILPEVRRVLKPGARAVITVPFCWNEHEVPYDYARYSSFGIKHLLEKNGFNVLKVTKSGHFTSVLLQLWALYFFELFRRWGRVGYALSMLFIVPVNISSVLFQWFLPRNDSLYFNNIVVAEKNTEASK